MMEKLLKRTLSVFFCIIMLVSTFSVSFCAFAVGQVKTLKNTSRTQTSISMSWTSVKGAKGYRVYSYDFAKKKWVSIKNTTSTSFTHSKLTSGKLYAYGVRAIATENGKNVLGKASNIIKVLTLPGNVSKLTASKLTTNGVTLSWPKTTGAKGYCLYQYNTAQKKYDRIAVLSSTSYTVKNLKANTSYKFGVRAYAQNGSVAYGKPAYLTVKTKAPAADYNIADLKLASVGENSFRITWTKAKSAVTGYQIGLYNAETKSWKRVATTSNTYMDFKNVESDATYVLTVGAYVKKSGGGHTFGPLAAPISAFAKPSAPKNLKGAQNGDNGISLTWDKVPGVAGYYIYTYNSTDGTWKKLASSTENHYNVKNIKETSAYTYKVCAAKKSDGKVFAGTFCQSVTVAYETHKEPGSIYSAEMEKSGILGYLYDPKGGYFYTSADPWQRNFGFNSLYDTAAPFTLINYETLRLRFPYGDKDWMIQCWKGQYGLVFYGGEVGVYTKPKDRELMHYDCASDDEMLKMSMVFNEKLFGKWYKRFTRPYGSYWWCTGFLPGNIFYDYDSIKVDMRITAKDYKMLDGMKQALKDNNISYTVKGLDVYFSY